MGGIRPRTSPGRRERNGSNSNEQSESIALISGENTRFRNNNLRTTLKKAILITSVVCSFIFAFYLGSWREKERLSVVFSRLQEPKKMKMFVHWRGLANNINQEGDLDREACIILSQCFTSKYLGADPIKYPDNPLQPCQKTLKMILRSYDNGFYYEGDKLVGFISGETVNGADFSFVNLYNVCIRPEGRGKGFAKSMVPEFVKQVVEKRVSKPNPRVYIGLDVDFGTETAVSAFSLYAKMGFNRWWEPCSSINDFDYRVLQRQHNLANPPDSSEKRPSVIFPMSQLFLRRKQTYKSQLFDEMGKPHNHFCMIMILGEDEFGTIGKEMKEIVQSALLEYKNNK